MNLDSTQIGETTTYKRFVALCEKITDYLKKKNDLSSKSKKLKGELIFIIMFLTLILTYNLFRIK